MLFGAAVGGQREEVHHIIMFIILTRVFFS
jgi:hypothetical protein